MTELMTRVLSAIPHNEAVSAEWIARHTIDDTTRSTIDALHHLQDADLVYLRNGFYRLSEAAKAARVDDMLRLGEDLEADPPLPDCVVQGDDEHWMVDR